MIDKKHWEAALAAQSACNLCGVVISFAAAMRALASDGLDTDARNRHPIAVLFATQVAHLTGVTSEKSFEQFETAYREALRQTGQM